MMAVPIGKTGTCPRWPDWPPVFERNENWQILSIEEIRKNWKDDVNHHLEPQAGDYVFLL